MIHRPIHQLNPRRGITHTFVKIKQSSPSCRPFSDQRLQSNTANPANPNKPTSNSSTISNSSSKSKSKPKSKPTNTFDNVSAYFNFTRGRFIQNEAYEMSQRRVSFDMNELVKVAAKATGSSCDGVKIKKYPDGMYNKTFLFTMTDGAQVVGKIPNPNAGRAHYTTASEVATMDFVRNILQTPVPQVYAWSSSADNPVGAEYIIMEKVPGVLLDDLWPKMDIKARWEFVQVLSRYQKAWTSASFSDVGALYYAQDVPKSLSTSCVYKNTDGKEVHDSRYVIGPCTGRDYIDEGRATIAFDRGPWSSVEEYKKAIGLREIACIRALPRLPKSPITLCGPGAYAPRREKKIAVLEDYLKLVPYLLPADSSIMQSYIWHSDLHIENIFVNPDNPKEILGIIDWQATDILPLFDHARQPYILDYDGPPVIGLERPDLPPDFKDLDPDEQRNAQILYYQQSLVALYRKLTHGINPEIYRAMEFRDTTSFDMLALAQNILIDGEALYHSRIVELEHVWQDLPGVQLCANDAGEIPAFPCKFTSEELEEIFKNEESVIRGMQYMQQVQQQVGEDMWPVKGVVKHEYYTEAKAALKKAKYRLFDQLGLDEQQRREWEDAWPFDD